jgi:hypothetical protein
MMVFLALLVCVVTGRMLSSCALLVRRMLCMLIVHRNLPLMGLFQHVLSLLHVLRFFVRAMVLYQLGAPRLHCEPALHEWAAGREDEHSPRSVPGQRVAARLQARDVPHGCAQRLPRCAHVVHLVAGMSSAVSRVAVPVSAPPFLHIPAPHGLMHVRNRGRRRAQRKRGAQADAAGRRRSHADAGPIGASPVFPLASGCQKMQNRAIYPVDLPQCRKRIFGSTGTNRRAFLAFAAALRYPTRATPARAHTALWPPASAGHRRKHGQCLPRLLLRAALGAHETLTPLRRPRVLRSAATPLRRAVPASSLTWCVPVLGCPRPRTAARAVRELTVRGALQIVKLHDFLHVSHVGGCAPSSSLVPQHHPHFSKLEVSATAVVLRSCPSRSWRRAADSR